MDLGNPASYLVLADGTPVLSSDGRELGRSSTCSRTPTPTSFDGVIVDMRAGHRFADASLVEAIYERGVVLAMSADAAEQLPEPSDNPATLEARPDDTAPDDFKDKLRAPGTTCPGRLGRAPKADRARMPRIPVNIADLVGRTPMVELTRAGAGRRAGVRQARDVQSRRLGQGPDRRGDDRGRRGGGPDRTRPDDDRRGHQRQHRDRARLRLRRPRLRPRRSRCRRA